MTCALNILHSCIYLIQRSFFSNKANYAKCLFSLLLLFQSFVFSEEASHVKIQLIQEGESLQIGKPSWIAIHIDIDKGWHIYWKDPGDVGIPLNIEWTTPAGLTMGTLQWAIPEKFVVADMVGYGYQGNVTLLCPLTATQEFSKQDHLELQAHITWLACSSTNCQPGGVDVHMPIKWDTSAFNNEEQIALLFKEARTKISPTSFSVAPQKKEGEALAIESTELTNQENEPIARSSLFVGGIAMALLFAFLGGILLNLMPCVLPVISFKIMSFVKMAGQSRLLIFKHGLMFSLGVLLSFWLLASVMLAFRSYGQMVGWGFQLQEPLFVIFLASILFIFSLSLFGIFEWGISVSSWAGQTAAEKTRELPGYMSSFFSGVLATAVATPCTGPFLGSAVGFAVTLPAIQALTIFTSLALGLCFPYLLLSAFPSYLRFLPKPGAWMETFKHLMGFCLLGTVLWLLWVFSAQTNTFSLMCVLVGFFCFSLAAWIYGKGGSPVNKKKVRLFTYVCVILFGWIGGKIILFPSATWNSQEASLNEKIISDAWEGWEEYSPERVAELRKEGKPLLIDFTAKWCLICQANHLVLTSDAVKQKLDQAGIVKMRADWTKNDPAITAELSKFGRNSVPLYVLYGTNEKNEPEILPQVLTPTIISSHLGREEIALETRKEGIKRDKKSALRENSRVR